MKNITLQVRSYPYKPMKDLNGEYKYPNMHHMLYALECCRPMCSGGYDLVIPIGLYGEGEFNLWGLESGARIDKTMKDMKFVNDEETKQTFESLLNMAANHLNKPKTITLKYDNDEYDLYDVDAMLSFNSNKDEVSHCLFHMIAKSEDELMEKIEKHYHIHRVEHITKLTS